MKIMIIAAIALMFAAASDPNPLVGRWETKPSPKGNVTGLYMKADSSFEGFFNKKPFVTGTYTYRDSLLSFVDNGCNRTRGLYKVIFFSEGDSNFLGADRGNAVIELEHLYIQLAGPERLQ